MGKNNKNSKIDRNTKLFANFTKKYNIGDFTTASNILITAIDEHNDKLIHQIIYYIILNYKRIDHIILTCQLCQSSDDYKFLSNSIINALVKNIVNNKFEWSAPKMYSDAPKILIDYCSHVSLEPFMERRFSEYISASFYDDYAGMFNKIFIAKSIPVVQSDYFVELKKKIIENNQLNSIECLQNTYFTFDVREKYTLDDFYVNLPAEYKLGVMI